MPIERPGTSPIAPTGSALAIELVELTGKSWVTPHTFNSLLEKFAVQNLAVQIQFLTGIKKILAALPVNIFDDADARDKLLSAAQDALDAAIEQEEEEE